MDKEQLVATTCVMALNVRSRDWQSQFACVCVCGARARARFDRNFFVLYFIVNISYVLTNGAPILYERVLRIILAKSFITCYIVKENVALLVAKYVVGVYAPIWLYCLLFIRSLRRYCKINGNLDTYTIVYRKSKFETLLTRCSVRILFPV